MTDIFDNMSEEERAKYMKMCADIDIVNENMTDTLGALRRVWRDFFTNWNIIFPLKRKKRRRPIMCNRRNHVGETYPGRSIKARAK